MAGSRGKRPFEMRNRRGETTCPGPKFRVQNSEFRDGGSEVDDEGPCLPSAPLQGHDGEAQTLAPLTVSPSLPPTTSSGLLPGILYGLGTVVCTDP